MQYLDVLKLSGLQTLQKLISIAVLSLVAGISGGGFVLSMFHSAEHISRGTSYGNYAFALSGTAIVFLVSTWCAKRQTSILSHLCSERLLLHIANSIRQAELTEIEHVSYSEIYVNMINTDAVNTVLMKSVYVFQYMIILGILWGYSFSLLPVFGLMMLMAALLGVMVYETMQTLAKPVMKAEHESMHYMFDVFRHILQGIKELKLHPLKSDVLFHQILKTAVCETKNLRLKMLHYFSSYDVFVNIEMLLLIGAVGFLFSVWFPNTLLLPFLMLIIYIWILITLILSMLPDIFREKAALDQFVNFLKKTAWIREPMEYVNCQSHTFVDSFQHIMFKDISYSYRSPDGIADFTLGPLNLTLQQGELLFITGGNGSGKTTLLKLLLGLYPFQSGVCHIDGETIRIQNYRSLFSAVFNDFQLFDTLYGLEHVDTAKLQHLLEIMQLSHKTHWTGERFSTITLSTGQRKRLALLVALMEDKPIYIFDEWAADQDPHFRQYFYTTLLPDLKRQGKTILVVTHDDRYFEVADRILTFEQGQLVSEKKQSPDTDTEKACQQERRTIMTFQTSERKKPPSDSRKMKHSASQKQQRGYFFKRIRELLYELFPASLTPIFMQGFFMRASDGICVLISFTALTIPHGYGSLEHTRLFFIFLIVLLLHFVSFYRFHTRLNQVIGDAVARLRLRMINQIRHAELWTLEQMTPESIYSVLAHDVKEIADLSNDTAYTMTAAFLIIILIFYSAVVSPFLLLTMLVSLCLGGIAYSYLQIRMKECGHRVRNEQKQALAVINSLLRGFKELRLNDQKSDAFFHHTFKPLANRLKRVKCEMDDHFLKNEILVEGGWRILMLAVVLLFPFWGVTSDQVAISVAIVLCMPISLFVVKIPRLTNSSLALQRVVQLDDALQDLASDHFSTEKAQESARNFTQLKYEDISFNYTNVNAEHFSLGPLSLNIRAGDIVFITGGNGSGKTTLLKLLTGLFSVDSGHIFLDTDEIDIRQYRSLFTAVFHDFHLFDRFYGFSDIDQKTIDDLLRMFKLSSKIQYKDGRFTSIDLSTGQRKRLALLMSIMEERLIYVFDEWAAEQDPEFRFYFYEHILPSFRAQGKTVIAVTHDDHYFHVADQVIKLEYGHIVNTFTPNISKKEE
jgi:putative ATP-binding cassette transporter